MRKNNLKLAKIKGSLHSVHIEKSETEVSQDNDHQLLKLLSNLLTPSELAGFESQ